MYFLFFGGGFQWRNQSAAQSAVWAHRFWGQDVWGAASVGGELHNTSRWLTCSLYYNIYSMQKRCFWFIFLCVLTQKKKKEHNWRPCTTCGLSGLTYWISANTGDMAAVVQSCGGCRQPFRSTPRRSAVWCCWLTTGSIRTVASREVRGHVFNFLLDEYSFWFWINDIIRQLLISLISQLVCCVVEW